MKHEEGKYTVETFSKKYKLTRQSTLNLFSKLKKQHFLTVSGGGKQKRIYTITKTKTHPSNGFYDLINKYSPIKLVPQYKHYVQGNYSIEKAIIDGINIGDARTLEATKYLFRHITNWKNLFFLAKKNDLINKIGPLYQQARKTVKKCRKMPLRYELKK